MRQRWVYPADGGEPFEAGTDYVAPQGHFIMGDLPAYQSPIDGRVVDGRAQRREDLRRSGSRPWEGREQEQKVAQQRVRDIEVQTERSVERSAHQAWATLSTASRRTLTRG